MKEGLTALCLALLLLILKTLIQIGESVARNADEIIEGISIVVIVFFCIVSLLLFSVWLVGKIVRGERLWVVNLVRFGWFFFSQGREYFKKD